uniref:F-box family protein n=1 Tax=Solanum tuberosum TaxID=4113 RepID=M1CY56_SOLTU
METYCCSNGIDRISSLPVDILHIILSNLCIFDVIHMTVLSKRWKNICTTIPYFRFDSNFSDSDPDFEEFKEFIDTFLISHKTISLVRFILSCSNMFESTDILRFIDAATRRNVEQLVLWFSPCEPFELPHCLVTCESLHVLKLNLCGYILKLPNHNHLGGFRQLKLLHLCNVELLDGHLTSCFFSECLLLEKLELCDCNLQHMNLLYIASKSLLYLTFDEGNYYDNCEIKISCPALKFLTYKSPMPKDIVINNLFSIEHVNINFDDYDRNCDEKIGILVHKMIKEAPSISLLKLCKASLKGLYKEACLSPICFNKLKSLKLKLGVDEDCMQVMIRLLKYSPNLEVLKLWCDEVRHFICEVM